MVGFFSELLGLVAGRSGGRPHHRRLALGLCLLCDRQLFFWPFGKAAVSRCELSGQLDLGTGPLAWIGNVVWFLLAGWWQARGHLTTAVDCFASIISIPFGIQNIKLAMIALAPIGMKVVPVPRLGRGSVVKRSNSRNLIGVSAERGAGAYHAKLERGLC